MLVDFAVDNREAYAWCLGHTGYRVTEAGSATEAFRKLDQQPPDLLITELTLPDLDGLEFCRQVRNPAERHDLPIIALTALPSTDRRVRGVAELGDVWVLPKPCLPLTLLQRTRAFLDQNASLRYRSQSAQHRSFALKQTTDTLLNRAEEARERARVSLTLSMATLTQRLRAECSNVSGVAITPRDVARGWQVPEAIAVASLTVLVGEGLVVKDAAGVYISTGWRLPA